MGRLIRVKHHHTGMTRPQHSRTTHHSLPPPLAPNLLLGRRRKAETLWKRSAPPPPQLPKTLNTDKPARDRSKDRKWDTTQTTEIGAGGDSDVSDKDFSMDVQHAEGSMEKQNNGTSPKRSKKLKTERPTTQTHERARSGTRRATHKGKQQ